MDMPFSSSVSVNDKKSTSNVTDATTISFLAMVISNP